MGQSGRVLEPAPATQYRARGHTPLKARELFAKAERAVTSANLLLESGDTNGACNRAYYAMHDAACAALLAAAAPVEGEIARTHSGLISAFSLHLVKPGRVSIDLGRAFSRVARLRLVADYKGGAVEREQAAWAVDQASAFVKAMLAGFAQDSVDPAKE